MNNFAKMSIVALTMAIAACSSGGGGGGNKNDASPAPKAEQKQNLKQGQEQKQAPKQNQKQQAPQEEDAKPQIPAPKIDIPETPKTKQNIQDQNQQAPKEDTKPQIPAPKVDIPEVQKPKQDSQDQKLQEPKDSPQAKTPDMAKVEGKAYISTLQLGQGNIPEQIKSLDFKSKEYSSNSITQLVIDGRTVEVSATDPDKSKHVLFKDGNLLSNDNIFSNVKYGFNQIGEKEWAYFIQGVKTAVDKMPHEGTFNYTGAYVSYGTYGEEKIGDTATFTADFSKRSVTGKLNAFFAENKDNTPANRDYSFLATIVGNRFHSSDVNGYFYGQDAGELAGVVENKDKNHLSVFGGKRDDLNKTK